MALSMYTESGRELLAACARHDRAARLGAELLELGVAEATLLHHFIGLVDVHGVRRLGARIANLHDLPRLRTRRWDRANHHTRRHSYVEEAVALRDLDRHGLAELHGPGRAEIRLGELRLAHDGEGGLRVEDGGEQNLALLRALGAFEVLQFEQPLARGDVHARVARGLGLVQDHPLRVLVRAVALVGEAVVALEHAGALHGEDALLGRPGVRNNDARERGGAVRL